MGVEHTNRERERDLEVIRCLIAPSPSLLQLSSSRLSPVPPSPLVHDPNVLGQLPRAEALRSAFVMFSARALPPFRPASDTSTDLGSFVAVMYPLYFERLVLVRGNNGLYTTRFVFLGPLG